MSLFAAESLLPAGRGVSGSMSVRLYMFQPPGEDPPRDAAAAPVSAPVGDRPDGAERPA